MPEYSKLTKDEKIERFLKAVENAFVGTAHQEFWPANEPQFTPYFDDFLAFYFFEKYKKNPQKFKQALNSLRSFLLRWYIPNISIVGFKVAQKYKVFPITPKESTEYFCFISDILAQKIYSEPFCNDGAVKVHNDREIKSLIDGLDWMSIKNRKEMLVLNSLSISAESYLWSVQFDVFAYGVEWLGPYESDENKTFIIKNFYDFDIPLWEHKFPYSKASFYFLFEELKPSDISIDLLGHTTYEKPIWQNLEKASFVLDKKPIKDFKKFEDLEKEFSTARAEQVAKVENLKPKGIIEKGAEIYYLMFKEFFKFYGDDWHPPKEVYRRIEKEGLRWWDRFKRAEQPSTEHYRKLYDPRNTYLG